MICVDTSIAITWIVQEDWADQARALYQATLRTGQPIVAPPLLPIEVTNALFQRTRSRGGFSPDEAHEQLAAFLQFRIEIHNPDGLHQRALALAIEIGLPAAYDAHFVALSNMFDCTLWADDRRLLRTIGDRLPFVRSISDYRRSPQ